MALKFTIGFYILGDENQVVKCDDTLWWGAWYENNSKKRRVANTTFGPDDTISVSTVFIGYDVALSPSAKPKVFKTMIFGAPLEGTRRLTATWEEAEQAHFDFCALVAKALAD